MSVLFLWLVFFGGINNLFRKKQRFVWMVELFQKIIKQEKFCEKKNE